MGLFDSILPSLFSAGNQVKKNVRGLLADPVGQSNNLARSVSDNLQGLLGPLAGIQAETARGQGVLGSDPALQQAARDRQVAAVSNFLAPMATVWHGSPHKFGKFDSSKIGTGEGAQAYGHGLYLADAQDVAQSYQALGHMKGNVAKVGRKPLQSLYDELANTEQSLFASQYVDQATKNARGRVISDQKAMLEDLMANKLPGDVVKAAQEAGYDATAVKWFEKQVVPRYHPSGNLYKVDLPDDAIAKMLDYDKPLSEQAPEVRAAVQKIAALPEFRSGMLGEAVQPFEMGSTTGQTVQNLLSRYFSGDNDKAAGVLHRAGLTGIRYLDGGSRGAGTGTSNYVVFPGNEGLLTILERNGKPLLGD
jgi:hypothetical protein